MRATGHCLCGTVSYRIDSQDPPSGIMMCHCQQCARWTGSLAAFIACRPDELAITGTPSWFRSSPDTRRGFCQACGSALFWQAEPGNRIYVTVGSLDPPTGLAIAEHIHTASKADWYDILDLAPQKAGE